MIYWTWTKKALGLAYWTRIDFTIKWTLIELIVSSKVNYSLGGILRIELGILRIELELCRSKSDPIQLKR